MSEFFYGWRRKAGCVLLATAMVFMALWIRSFDPTKSFEIDYSPGNICWLELGLNPTRLIIRTVPYWPIVVPLTLLSAYLILWPGKRKAAQPTQNSTTPTSDLHS